MKIALVHELLTMRGGAERVLRILADMYPQAPIYTLLYDEKKLGEWFPTDRVRTSTLQKWAKFSTNHHLYLRRMPAAVEAWDFSEYDAVISTSSAFAHGIITNGKPKHLTYIHAPARYLWDRTFDVQERAAQGVLGPLKKRYLQNTFHTLRQWDAEVAPRADKVLAASDEVKRRIELYWRRESDTVHPPIDDYWLSNQPQKASGEYFLIVSTLVPYKQIDLAIQACNAAKVPLKIAGEGPDSNRLQKLAGPTVELLGYKTQAELRALYASASAVIFPGQEDFGLVPLEAMACGTPVIAYRSGGALETVIENETGIFFDEQTPDAVVAALTSFNPEAFDANTCQARAAQFSRETFETKIRNAVAAL